MEDAMEDMEDSRIKFHRPICTGGLPGNRQKRYHTYMEDGENTDKETVERRRQRSTVTRLTKGEALKRAQLPAYGQRHAVYRRTMTKLLTQ